MVAGRSEQLCHAGEDPVGSRGTATRSSPQTSDVIPRSRFQRGNEIGLRALVHDLAALVPAIGVDNAHADVVSPQDSLSYAMFSMRWFSFTCLSPLRALRRPTPSMRR